MKSFVKLAVAAGMLSLVAAPVSAQAWKWDLGVNAGYSKFTNMLDQDQTTLDGAGSKVYFAPGILYGAQLTMWTGPKLGFRLNGRYASRDVKGNDLDDIVDGFDFVEDVNLWAGTLDALFRFKAPAEEFTKMEMLPYLAIGAGLKWHNPGFDDFTCNDPEEDKSWTCGPFMTGIPGAPLQWAIGEQKVFVGHVGLGADWRLARNFALRTELSDQIFQPQIYRAARQGTTNNYTLTDGDENESNWIHELGVQLGLHMLFGVPRAVAVAVTPAPPPPVQQPVTRPPEPRPEPPREDRITVCVVDPTAPGGIRMQTAVFIPSRGDTLIDVNGQRTLLRNAIGNVMVASNADWYVRGQPLEMTIGTEKVQFVTTQSPRMIEASNLAFRSEERRVGKECSVRLAPAHGAGRVP